MKIRNNNPTLEEVIAKRIPMKLEDFVNTYAMKDTHVVYGGMKLMAKDNKRYLLQYNKDTEMFSIYMGYVV